MSFDRGRALELLRIGTGKKDACFREGQEEAIRMIVENQGRLLVVQKTGWGKSSVYFISTKLLRENGHGPTLLISPLLSLMRNQIAAAKRMGIRAETINSDNEDRWPDIENLFLRDTIDILLISPERLANERFRTNILAPVADNIAMLVVDEVHCISDWGHDFRPHYRLIERIVHNLPPNLRLLATTATANDRVMQDLKSVLGQKLMITRGDLNRPSLALQTIRLPDQAQRLAWLAEHVANLPGHGIIYTLTVRDALCVTEWLQSRGLNVEAYTSQSGEIRTVLEESLLSNQVKALVATTALGMGFDKPDLAFVIHYQTPGSVVAYYQQVGRAGRAIDAAYGILLSGKEETEITDFFMNSAFPAPEEVQMILDELNQFPEGLSVYELMARLNISKSRIEKTMQLLSLESPPPIGKLGAKWRLAAASLSHEFWNRADRLTALRKHEQQQMQNYVRLQTGHMEFLIRALDGDPSGITPPVLPALPTTPDPRIAQEAVAFIGGRSLIMNPRAQWPAGGLPQYRLKGKIPVEHRAQAGRVLSIWGDAGWGRLVREGKYRNNYFPDDLVTACAALVKVWNPQPYPAWVTCIPSLRRPDLVPDFSQRLAAALELSFYPVLIRTEYRKEQKKMANSSQQARNVDGSLALWQDPLPEGPVFLVDDLVDSRWTITVATWLLRSFGGGEVFPLILAEAGQNDEI